jgi:hypothetical protein
MDCGPYDHGRNDGGQTENREVIRRRIAFDVRCRSIDDAYRAKYHDSAYLNPMISARARSATVKVMPRGE